MDASEPPRVEGWSKQALEPTGAMFIDLTSAPGNDGLDGLKVDQKGNGYSTGPGGLWIISSEGTQLVRMKGSEDPHTMAWGDADGKTLYITTLTGRDRLRLNISGVCP